MLTLYNTILTFNNLEKRNLLKTLWEKEKMLVTSMFSFSFSTLPPQSFYFTAKSILSSANTYNSFLDKSRSFSIRKEFMCLKRCAPSNNTPFPPHMFLNKNYFSRKYKITEMFGNDLALNLIFTPLVSRPFSSSSLSNITQL